jgi:DNA-binding response OmpR family regulator
VNILIVEDDPVIADAIGMILTQAGYYHVHARTIEAALSALNYS